MQNGATAQNQVSLEVIRSLWKAASPNTDLFVDDAAWELEAYGRTTACCVGLRLRAINHILRKSQADQRLKEHMDQLFKECELLVKITSFMFDQLPRSE